MTQAAAPRPPERVIEVEDLVSFYGPRQILRGVSVEVVEGEIMVIMGGSGSGKSTLLRHLMALEWPTSGTVRLLGRDLAALSAREMFELRKKIGVAFPGWRALQLHDRGREHHASAPRTHRA